MYREYLNKHLAEQSEASKTILMANKKNPFAGKAKAEAKKKKPSGKRIGKSKPAKADNQLNRRVK